MEVGSSTRQLVGEQSSQGLRQAGRLQENQPASFDETPVLPMPTPARQPASFDETPVRPMPTPARQPASFDETPVRPMSRARTAYHGFRASEAFTGRRQGYIYKKGPAGLGYYVDDSRASQTSGSPTLVVQDNMAGVSNQAQSYRQGDFIQASSFSGRKPGYAFKMGHQGLGYYRC